MANVIEATKEGQCPLCSKPINLGERIAKDRKTGKWAHADCIWPKGAGQGQSGGNKPRGSPGAGTSQAQPEKPKMTFEEQADLLAIHAEIRLRKAIEVTKRVFPNLTGIEQVPVVIEVAHQLYGEASTLRIQKRE